MTMHVICLKNQTKFEASSEATILDAALAKEVVLNHSCKTGRCGVCKVLVLQGETRVSQPEVALSDAELEDGYILTCCRLASSNLTLNVEDLPQLNGIRSATHPAKIDSIEPLSPEVMQVALRFPPALKIKYLAGQYVNIIIPGGERRSYSIANAPRDDGKMFFQIKKVSDGVLSQYWFEKAKMGDLLRVEAPLGTFFLRDTNIKHLVFLATGTGIAPVQALLQGLFKSCEPQSQKPHVHVYWGNRSFQDIYSLQLDNQIEGVSWNNVLSKPDKNWHGLTGYVQDAFFSTQIPLDEVAIYACGSMNMINTVASLLAEKSFDMGRFYSDAFVSSNESKKTGK